MNNIPNIKDIPLDDVEKTLTDNSIYNEKDPYELINDLIFSGELEHASNSVVNWILAYNVKKQNLGIYNISQIIRASNEELKILSEELGLDEVNKNNIIQILSYLDKVKDDLAMLPDDVLIKIMAELDYDDLKLLNETSKSVNDLYHSNKFSYLLKQKLKDKDDEKYKWRFEGIIDDGIFIIKDKNNADKICNNLSYEQLVDIMWSIGVYVEIKLPKSYNGKIYISYLAGIFNINTGRGKQTARRGKSTKHHNIRPNRIIAKGDLKEWPLDKLKYYYYLFTSDPEKEQMCNMIEKRMEELGTLKYDEI